MSIIQTLTFLWHLHACVYCTLITFTSTAMCHPLLLSPGPFTSPVIPILIVCLCFQDSANEKTGSVLTWNISWWNGNHQFLGGTSDERGAGVSWAAIMTGLWAERVRTTVEGQFRAAAYDNVQSASVCLTLAVWDRTGHVAQAGLQLRNFQFLSPKCWDYRPLPPYPAQSCCLSNKLSCRLFLKFLFSERTLTITGLSFMCEYEMRKWCSLGVPLSSPVLCH